MSDWMTVTIEWGLGIFFSIFYTLFLFALWLGRRRPIVRRCPHGFVDWDRCPICCH